MKTQVVTIRVCILRSFWLITAMFLPILGQAQGAFFTNSPAFSPNVPSSSNGPVDYYYVWDSYSGGGAVCDASPNLGLGVGGVDVYAVTADGSDPVALFSNPTDGAAMWGRESYRDCYELGRLDIAVTVSNGTYTFTTNYDSGGPWGDPFDFYNRVASTVNDGPPGNGSSGDGNIGITGTNSCDGLWEVDYQLQPETNSYVEISDCQLGCNNEAWGWSSGFYWIHVHLNQGVTLPPGALPPLPQYPVVGVVGSQEPLFIPYVSIFTPITNTVYPAAPAVVPIAIDAADVNPNGAITGVAVFEGGTPIGTATLTVNPYSFNGYLYTFFWTNVPAGTHTLTAVAANNYGKANSSSPITIQVGNGCSSQLAACYFHTLAVKPDGTVNGWGQNESGEVGDGTLFNRPSPMPVSGLSGIKMVAAGASHSLALGSNGLAWSWGANTYGQLGGPYYTYGASYETTPVQVSQSTVPLTNITWIAAGRNSSYAVRGDGSVWSWGYNGDGELGNGYSGGSVPAPFKISGLSGVKQVAAGNYHVLAVTTNGNVYAWGLNTNGELGDGTVTNRNSPVLITTLSNIVAVTAGNSSSYALDSCGIVWAWGGNGSGQLGLGTTTEVHTPTPVLGLTGYQILGISSGYSFCLALVNDGSFEGWGANGSGSLGNGTTAPTTTPISVKFPDGSQAVGLATGVNDGFSIQTDGTLRSWGGNPFGDLGRTITGGYSATPGAITGF
jgi:alpha-tubulin suppressor-like RCC1 family protein